MNSRENILALQCGISGHLDSTEVFLTFIYSRLLLSSVKSTRFFHSRLINKFSGSFSECGKNRFASTFSAPPDSTRASFSFLLLLAHWKERRHIRKINLADLRAFSCSGINFVNESSILELASQHKYYYRYLS